MTSDEERMVICEEEGDDDVIGESRLFIYHHHHLVHGLLNVIKFTILAATCCLTCPLKLYLNPPATQFQVLKCSL